MNLPLSVYATLPVWPLLGAILVGLWLLTKPRPEPAGGHEPHGHDAGHSHGDRVISQAH